MWQADAAVEMAAIDKAKTILSTGETGIARVMAEKRCGGEDGDAVVLKETGSAPRSRWR